MMYKVNFDSANKNGFLVTKSEQFTTLQGAMAFIREIQAKGKIRGKPTLEKS
jgi:hypothetical protein